jgi:hypothetical protein
MEVALGSIDEQNEQKKKKKVKLSFSQKRSPDGSFPKKGRQLFVAAKMAPLSNFLFWVRHWPNHSRKFEEFNP